MIMIQCIAIRKDDDANETNRWNIFWYRQNIGKTLI